VEGANGNFAVGPVLWPDEAAWRLMLEIERKSGFSASELVCFTNVPVPLPGRTNSLAITRRVSGLDFALREVIHRPDLTEYFLSSDASSVRVEHGGIPEGHTFCFLEARGENRTRLEVVSQIVRGTSYEIYFRSIPDQVKTLNLTYVIQPIRTVEFLVKPEIAGPRGERASR
jgi:hypothetical protein